MASRLGWGVAIGVLLFASACADSSATPTQAVAPTPNVQATVEAAVRASVVARPTSTPAPTATIIIAPTATSVPEPSPTTAPTAAPAPKAGDVGRLTLQGKDAPGIPVAFSEGAYQMWMKVATAGDTIGMLEMLSNGQVALAEEGTAVRVLDSGGGLFSGPLRLQVRIESGRLRGSAGWVQPGLVVSAGRPTPETVVPRDPFSMLVLVGKQAGPAESVLRDFGHDVAIKRVKDKSPAGTVIATEPPEGTKTGVPKTVTLIVSAGP